MQIMVITRKLGSWARVACWPLKAPPDHWLNCFTERGKWHSSRTKNFAAHKEEEYPHVTPTRLAVTRKGRLNVDIAKRPKV